MPTDIIYSNTHKPKRNRDHKFRNILFAVLLLLLCLAVAITSGIIVYRKSRQQPPAGKAPAAAAPSTAVPVKSIEAPSTPDMDLTINELWTQRSEDNRYRAKQRLDAKLIRVTGSVEDISERSCSITGARSSIGPVNLAVSLSDTYANKIQAGLVFVERGTRVSVQGRFSFDKMGLSDAVFVDRTTGRILLSDDLKELSRVGDPSLRPAVKESAQKPE